MAAQVRIPLAYRSLTGGNTIIELEGKTIQEIIERLEDTYPGMKAKLCDRENNLKNSIDIYVNRKDIRKLNGKDCVIRDGDEITLLPTVAGG